MDDKIIKLLKKYTGHRHVRLTDRGNSAIFAALHIAMNANRKAFFLIPDQGGWVSYKTYPELLKMNVKEVKTNYGVIDLEDLKEKAKTGSALILSSFAGYFAEQPMAEISKICKENKCLLIEDASSAIGDDLLCNGDHSDIIVGSFGNWKPVNVGYGGFISTNSGTYLQNASVPFSLTKVYPDSHKEILKKLTNSPKRIELFIEAAKKVKEDLSQYNILHESKRGLNVAVRYESEKEKQEIIAYCEKNNFDYVECPKYERVNEDAISIEIKRI